jgi:probable rRNA maturation factor
MPQILISFYNQDTFYKLKGKKELRTIVLKILKKEKKKAGEITVVTCSDNYLLDINKKHLKHNYFTDIITFDYSEERINGDLFISIDRIRENAKTFKVTINNELKRVLIHGILHLCGYKDKSSEQKKQMKQKEDYYLSLS